MTVTLAHPDLEDFADSLDVLGPEGMSADESDEDDEEESLPLKVLLHPWRSIAVSEWLQTLDDVYIYDEMRTKTTCNIPEARQRTLIPFHGSIAVRGLPYNFYRLKWLKTLNPPKMSDLRVQVPVILQYTDKIVR
jgi:hypothetical protein